MPSAPGPLDRIEHAIEHVAGIRIDGERKEALAQAVAARAQATCRGNLEAYLRHIDSAVDGGQELLRLSAELSVGETHFHRQVEHWRALAERVLPERLRARGDVRALRMLSAGCATGEEPHTLAIVLSEVTPVPDDAAPVILGLDIHGGFIEQARKGRYRAWSLRGVPDTVRDACFARRGDEFELLPRYRRMVAFQQGNLHDPEAPWWRAKELDVVLLRNVTMYHTLKATRALMERAAASLVPGGYLFLGHAETLRGISEQFHLVHSHDAFYYQKKLTEDGRGESRATDGPGAGSAARTPPRGRDGQDGNWAAAIADASRRIDALGRRGGTRGGSPAQSSEALQEPSMQPTPKLLADLASLIQRKRFDDADALVRSLAPAVADQGVAILAAALELARGRIASAVEQLAVVLQNDELQADARHLLALCHEHSGDVASAMEENRVAIYLDQSFAAPHVQAARLARSAGDRKTWRRALKSAIELLPGELELRVRLFGGGFAREALERMCRRELEDLQGADE